MTMASSARDGRRLRRGVALVALALLGNAPPAPPTGKPGAHVAPPVPIEKVGVLEVRRNGTEPMMIGPADAFTGHARLDMAFVGAAPSSLHVSVVTFDAGARTAWHSHPLGQLLIGSAGCGWVQAEGGPVAVLRPGDMIWTPPGVRHWHGGTATAGSTMTAVVEAKDGNSSTWGALVTDADYKAAAARSGC